MPPRSDTYGPPPLEGPIPGAEKYLVTLSSIEVTKKKTGQGSQWVTVVEGPVTFDLLNLLRGGASVLLAFAVPLVAYLFTLAPTVFRYDSAEFSATGYPLYMMLGKLFTFLPVGDVGYRLNLMSALFGAGVVAVLYQLLYLLTFRRVLSLATALFFGFSYYFWTSAVVAEVYTLHALLTGAVLLLTLILGPPERKRYLYMAVGIWGLSFGNHMSTVLLGLALAFMVLTGIRGGAVTGKNHLPLAGLVLLGFVSYAYLPWRYLAGGIPNWRRSTTAPESWSGWT